MQEVRVHEQLLIQHPAFKLWYFLRAHDKLGRGWVVVGFPELSLFKESQSTIYRWLNQGQSLGIFRRYNWKNGQLTVWLGGLFPTCLKFGIKNWGATSTIPLEMLLESNGRKNVATALATQDMQSRSRYAATHSLNRRERKFYKLPTVDDIFNQASDTSPKLRRGVKTVPGVIAVTDNRILADNTFIPFGASQKRISENLACHPTTMRRRLDKMGVKSRQIVQTKPEYAEINFALEHEAHSWESGDVSYYQVNQESITLIEKNGACSASRRNGHLMTPKRFYQAKSGKFFIYRCNLYNLDFKLESMKCARMRFKRLLKRFAMEAGDRESVPSTP
ncbi:hypothetical protein [Anabaena sp. PCC 7108]|uniref:hypothetical protein n=1 Tax=Anabaena sp. PCC 7108 TaxID=163908 RepID=UPI000346A8BF|nr:hypothetical protein [Anabaena sp. PCC 7108]